jgi:hypothetical protein
MKRYDCENAHRTSNMVGRLMKFIDRACFDAQYFHGTDDSAEQHAWAMALLKHHGANLSCLTSEWQTIY